MPVTLFRPIGLGDLVSPSEGGGTPSFRRGQAGFGTSSSRAFRAGACTANTRRYGLAGMPFDNGNHSPNDRHKDGHSLLTRRPPPVTGRGQTHIAGGPDKLTMGTATHCLAIASATRRARVGACPSVGRAGWIRAARGSASASRNL